MIAIGIDPGKSTGIGVYENGCLTKLFCTDFWGCIDFINSYKDRSVFILEKPRTKTVWNKRLSNTMSKCLITGVNVGFVIKESELICEYLRREKQTFALQHPSGKLSNDEFKRITKWDGRTNQHMRDAGMLCFGVNNLNRLKQL